PPSLSILSLHDALPILGFADLVAERAGVGHAAIAMADPGLELGPAAGAPDHADVPDQPALVVGEQARLGRVGDQFAVDDDGEAGDRKSTRLNSSHVAIS